MSKPVFDDSVLVRAYARELGKKYCDPFTGKRVDGIGDLLPSRGTSQCDECGTTLINRCMSCGAPVCCPKCCAEGE